jgi:hypothetical protein
MRHPPAKLLNSLQFRWALALAPGLRSEFADIAEDPIPESLAALVRRLGAEGDESSGQGRDHGPRTTETSNIVDRGGRR